MVQLRSQSHPARPPASQALPGLGPRAGGQPGLQVLGTIWRFTVDSGAPDFVHHYPMLTEAADDSVSLVLASISRLVEKKNLKNSALRCESPPSGLGNQLGSVSAPKEVGILFLGMERAKERGPGNWGNSSSSWKLKP